MRHRLTTLVLLLGLTAATLAQPPKPPDVPVPVDDKIRDLFKSGKFDDAFKELQAAAKTDAKRPPPRITLAHLFFQAGQGQNARLNLERAAAEDPRHPEVYILNSIFAFNEGRYTDTVLSGQQVLSLAAEPRWDPDQRKRFVREGRLAMAAAFEARSDWNSARDQYVAVLNDDPKNGVVRQRLGGVTFQLGRPDDAFKEFQTAQQDDPASDLPELRMAALYSTKGEMEKTEEWLKKAVATHPKDAKAPRTYASWLLDHGKVDEAQLYLDAAVKLDMNSRESTQLKGLIARLRKDYATAETIFDGLHREYPNDSPYAWNLILALAESGNKDKLRRAIDLAEGEVRKNSKLVEGLAVLGWCYYKAGRIDEAERALSQAVQTGSLSRDAAYFVARLMADKQRWDEASKILKVTADTKGGHVYRTEAQALQAEVEKHVPKKDESKKEEPKKP